VTEVAHQGDLEGLQEFDSAPDEAGGTRARFSRKVATIHQRDLESLGAQGCCRDRAIDAAAHDEDVEDSLAQLLVAAEGGHAIVLLKPKWTRLKSCR
jgi:hypothetical protein